MADSRGRRLAREDAERRGFDRGLGRDGELDDAEVDRLAVARGDRPVTPAGVHVLVAEGEHHRVAGGARIHPDVLEIADREVFRLAVELQAEAVHHVGSDGSAAEELDDGHQRVGGADQSRRFLVVTGEGLPLARHAQHG
jgi:hypothetical protein